MLAWAEQARRRLTELSGDDDRIGVLGAEEARLAETVRDLGGKLTSLRKEAAERFAAAVTEELSVLAIPHAKITVPVMPQDEYGPHGADEVEIRLAAHPGTPTLSLAKGASGGELSRVMLAVEVVLAGADRCHDRVRRGRRGVGGKAAVEIRRRVARLAARAGHRRHPPAAGRRVRRHHVVVKKASDGSVMRSGVSRLDDAGRVRGAVPDAGRTRGLGVRPGARRRASRRRGSGARQPAVLARRVGRGSGPNDSWRRFFTNSRPSHHEGLTWLSCDASRAVSSCARDRPSPRGWPGVTFRFSKPRSGRGGTRGRRRCAVTSRRAIGGLAGLALRGGVPGGGRGTWPWRCPPPARPGRAAGPTGPSSTSTRRAAV